MSKDSDNIFELRKVISEKGTYVRQEPRLDSKKVMLEPLEENVLIAIKNPPNIKVVSNKHRIEIIQPIKGWIYEDDILNLDTVEYLRYGRDYQKKLVAVLKKIGIKNFLEDIQFVDENKIEIVKIPKQHIDKEKDITHLKSFSDIFDNEFTEKEKKKDNLIENITSTKFENELPNINMPVLLYCGASWCGPCQTFKPLLKKQVTKIGNIKLYLLDVDEESDISDKLGIEQVPMLFFYNKGKIVNHLVGAPQSSEELEDILKKFKNEYDGVTHKNADHEKKNVSEKEKPIVKPEKVIAKSSTPKKKHRKNLSLKRK